MLAPIEQLKKETIALATHVEHFFLNQFKEDDMSYLKVDNLHRIQQNTFRILMTKRALDQKQVRFLTTAMNSANSLYKIYQLTKRSYSSKLKSQVFSTEIKDLKKDLGDKLQKSIDAFSYGYKELTLDLHEKRRKYQVKLQRVENKILEALEDHPRLTPEGLPALKQLSLFQFIDDEINEIIDNILYNQGHVNYIDEEKVEKVNMLDYINSNGLMKELRGNL